MDINGYTNVVLTIFLLKNKMIKLCDTVKNGRLGNKLMQNIGISVLVKTRIYV